MQQKQIVQALNDSEQSPWARWVMSVRIKAYNPKRKQVLCQISALCKLSNKEFSGPLCALLLRWQQSLIISVGRKSASN